MSTIAAKIVGTLFVAAFVSVPTTTLGQVAAPSPGLLVLPPLESLEPQAKDSVSISLDAALLATAASFLDSGQPDERTVKEIIAGLQGVYVRSYTFDHAFVYPANAIESLRKQLHTTCWQSIMSVHKDKEESAIDIFICQLQQKARGLAIIATEPRELTIVNIVGAIDLDKLHRLEGHFGIPRLPAAK
jgi:hypothetical protein